MAAQAASWIGQRVLSKRYEIVSELGRNDRVLIYRARDSRLGCEVAIKVPQPALLQDAALARRLEHELQALAQLSHPHLVHVLDHGEHQGTPFAVLQYVGGESLRRRHGGERSGGAAAALRELRGWLPQAASALDYIHSQQFVHRDIRPETILFDVEGKPYVRDCAFAATAAGAESIAGQYLAPELIHGGRGDGRADQFALAVTVYEVLAGKPPFAGPSLTGLAEQQKQGPARLDECFPVIPEHAALAVQQALHIDPQRRFKTCEAFAAAVLTAGAAPPRVERIPRPAPVPPPAATLVETAAVYCPHCRKKVGVRARLQGRKAQCVHCQTTFVVPRLAEMPATELVPPPPSPEPHGRRRWLGWAAVLLIVLAALAGCVYAYYQDIEEFWDNL